MVQVKPTVLDVARAVTELTEAHTDRRNMIARGELPGSAETERITDALHKTARSVAYHRERAGVIERGKYSVPHARAVLSALGADRDTVEAHAHDLAKLVRNTFG